MEGEVVAVWVGLAVGLALGIGWDNLVAQEVAFLAVAWDLAFLAEGLNNHRYYLHNVGKIRLLAFFGCSLFHSHLGFGILSLII